MFMQEATEQPKKADARSGRLRPDRVAVVSAVSRGGSQALPMSCKSLSGSLTSFVDGLKGTTMTDAPMPVTGFSMDIAMSEDGQTMVALLTLETGELAFEFAINEEGAEVMVENLQQFLGMCSGTAQ
jgi:hypothetical protein